MFALQRYNGKKNKLSKVKKQKNDKIEKKLKLQKFWDICGEM